nr:unnamed protein product [Digitaria exilis]
MREHRTLPAEVDLVNSCPDWLLLLLNRCWNVRNGVLKEGETVSIEGSVMFLNCYRESLLLVRQQKVAVDDRGKQKVQAFDVPSCAKEPRLGKRWNPPAVGALKINVDGAFCRKSGAAGVGVVVRDVASWPAAVDGEQIKIFHCRDVEEAEALACLEGVRMGSRWFN